MGQPRMITNTTYCKIFPVIGIFWINSKVVRGNQPIKIDISKKLYSGTNFCVLWHFSLKILRQFLKRFSQSDMFWNISLRFRLFKLNLKFHKNWNFICKNYLKKLKSLLLDLIFQKAFNEFIIINLKNLLPHLLLFLL